MINMMDNQLHYRKMGNLVLPPEPPRVKGIEVHPEQEIWSVPDMRIRGEEQHIKDANIRCSIMERDFLFREGQARVPSIPMPDIRMTKDPTMIGVIKKSLSEDIGIRVDMAKDIMSKYPSKSLPPMKMADDPRTKMPQVFLPPYLRPDLPELPRMKMEEHYEPVVEKVYPPLLPSDFKGLTASTSPYGAFGVYTGRAFGEVSKAVGLMVGKY